MIGLSLEFRFLRRYQVVFLGIIHLYYREKAPVPVKKMCALELNSLL